MEFPVECPSGTLADKGADDGYQGASTTLALDWVAASVPTP